MNAELHEAVRDGDAARARALLDATPSLVHETLDATQSLSRHGGGTALHLAVASARLDVARLLVERGIDLDTRNGEGRTALHDAIEHGAQEIERLLLDHGAEVDLCAAAILGRIDRVRELLDADPPAANDRSTRLSPLGWAAFGNRVDVARELLARGARMDDGELLCAASVGHVEVGRVLLDHGAEPDEIPAGCDGTALHAAAGMRYTRDSSGFVILLLAAGADPRVRNTAGKTALEIADAAAARQREHPRAPGCAAEECNYEGVATLLRRAESDAG